MKKILLILVAFVVVFAGCSTDNGSNDEIDRGSKTSLTFNNMSSYNLLGVEYASVNFGDINSGRDAAENVSKGTRYMFFNLLINNEQVRCRTTNLVTCIEGIDNEVTIQNSTLITATEDDISDTLKNTFDRYNVITTLTINNTSDYNIIDVEYFGVKFGNINSGLNQTREVSAGTRDIFFYLEIGGESIRCRTTGVTTIKDIKNEYTFTNSTIITVIADDITDSLKSIIDTMTIELNKPQIVIKQGNTIIVQHGDFNFGTVFLNTTKELIFTIDNTGKTSLVFETVNNNRINMTDNTSDYFSVLLQPLSPTVAPGSSVTFNIRFNPTTKGNNYAASMEIKTNSRYNEEFIFRVIGNCSNEYQIGDTGLGGGMVFYAQGGQYKECSGELGTYNWENANTTASSYNGGGFSDWYLPDRGELDLMYENLHMKNLGGFLASEYACYWSSTRNPSTSNLYYYYKFFEKTGYYAGRWDSGSISSSCRVRAVRAFTLN